MVCKNCGCKIPDGATSCRVCGGGEAAESRPVPQMSPAFFKAPDLEVTPRVPKNPCPYCGRELPKDATFCGGCQKYLRTEPIKMANPLPSVEVPEPKPVLEETVVPEIIVENLAVSEPAAEKPVVAEPIVEIPAPTKTCPSCDREIPMAAKFCNGCGRSMEEKPAAVPVEPIPVTPPVPEPIIEIPAPTKTCPSCGREIPVAAKFCSGCGAKTDGTPMVPPAPTAPAAAKLCPDCGKELAMEAKFCNGCGCNLAASAITNAAAVTVTDPVVTTAEKKARAKKAKSPKSGKGIVIAVVAIALAIVVGLGVWFALEDPFDWFSGTGSSQQDDKDKEEKPKTAEDVAVAHIKALESSDAEKYCSYYHSAILQKRIEDSGYSDQDSYIAYLQNSMDDRQSDMEEDLGGEYSYSVKAIDTDTFTGDDMEIIKASYVTGYDLEIEGYKVVKVETTFTTDEDENTVEYECPMIKMDGKWYLGG